VCVDAKIKLKKQEQQPELVVVMCVLREFDFLKWRTSVCACMLKLCLLCC